MFQNYSRPFIRFLLIFLFLISTGCKLFAQNDSTIYRIACSKCKKEALEILEKNPKYFSAADLNKVDKNILMPLYEAGWLMANIEKSDNCSTDSCTLVLNTGPQFRWTKLENANIPKQLLRSLGYNELLLKDKLFNARELNKIRSRVLKNCENNAYPFAQIYFDSISADSTGTISAKVYLDYGPEITMDSLQIIGKSANGLEQKTKISRKFLANYLDLKKGDPYNEEQILKINKKIRELPYLSAYKTPQVLFMGQKAYPLLFLETRRASRFDVLFGLLPNSTAVPGQRRYNFTGNVNIDLLNSFGRGERLMAQWQQFQVGRSELKLGFSIPYLFNTPIGTDFKFELYRRDSSYVDVISDLGLSYLFDGNNYLRFFWKKSSTNVQSFNTEAIINSRKLPTILDIRNNAIGAEYYYQRLNYRFNPLSGFELRLEGSLGYKFIKKNNSILNLSDPTNPDFNFESLYDSISVSGLQYNAQLSYAHFFNLWKQLTLMGRYRSAVVFNSKNQLYTNELYRIGGQQIMRGFDEQSIFSSWYQVLTTELRYLLGNNSYSYVFSDIGYTENWSLDANLPKWRYGFGVGIALETKVGIFGLSYALGSSFDQQLIFRNGKIHFGYLNLF
jgi:outer membrane protein assembly factor BamA